MAQDFIEIIPSAPPLIGRPRDGHKGTFGRVLVVGGSSGMFGAPALTGTAALRMGAGLVELAVPAAILPHCIGITPELIGIGLDDAGDPQALLEAASKSDVVAVGPGLGKSSQAEARVMALIAQRDQSMVIDADALNLLAQQAAWPKQFSAHAVLTPHPGEMKRLAKFIGRDSVPSDRAGRVEVAAELARHTGQVVVLKGAGTVVTDGGRVFINNTGDSSLSKGGTGDVLTGIIASLIAQGMDRFDAAAAGVHLHGLAGQLAGKRLGQRSVLARDVIDAIPVAIAHLSCHRS